ncbi:carbon monoxide dehydrogenase, partial [Micromonospora sp. CV4]
TASAAAVATTPATAAVAPSPVESPPRTSSPAESPLTPSPAGSALTEPPGIGPLATEAVPAGPAATGTRTTPDAEPEALDLLSIAGGSITKRLVPVIVGLVAVGAVIAWLVARR